MKCPKCNFENREDAKFCNECGHKFEINCPECGTTNRLGSKFCDECGTKLSLPIEQAPKDLSFDEKLAKFQKYLPEGLTEKILSQRDRIEGERKQVTVMFCDMEGFTPLSERLGPEEAYGIMDQVYEILIHKVHDYEGTVNEMTGDGIMALFGAPIALEDAPQRAIRSAVAIHRELAKLSDKLKHEKGSIPTLKMRIGIHTGPVVVGTLGNDLRVEFKAVGDTVNLASRMEGLADPGTTFVSEETFKLTEGLFRFEALGEREVKGKEEPIKVFQAIAASTRRTRFDVSAERGLTPFVGRERELELLMDGFERCKEGRGQAFSIVAEAGLGKSRLLYEFRKSVANENVTFLEGKCLSYSRAMAYYSVIDVLKSNFNVQEGESDFEIRQKVKEGIQSLQVDEASTLPYLLELLLVKNGGIDQTPMSPEIRKTRTLDALTRIVLKGSEIRPLIMAIEDLHWVDKSSEESFMQLLESISGARVLLIFTFRPEFVHTWGGRSYHSQLNLNRLSNRESLLMVAHLLGTNEPAPDLENLILDKTEGVPFFIEEFIKSLKNLRIIELREDKYYLTGQTQDLVIPSTIHDVIMARVDTLPEGAKEVLLRGSVIGREFNHELIKEITDLDEHELLSFLAALRDAELIYERGIYPACTYIFKHALTCEVIYESILTKKRKKLHLGIGMAIEKNQSERLEEFYEILAYHYSNSENKEKAYQYLRLCGNKTSRSYANNDAFRYYKSAIELLTKMPDTEENKREQIDVRLEIWVPMGPLGYPEDSLQILKDAEKISEEIGDERNHAILQSKLSNYYLVKGDILQSIKFAEKGFQEAKKFGEVDLMIPNGIELSNSYRLRGEFLKVIDLVPKIMRVVERTHRESDFFGRLFNVYAELHGHYAVGLANLGKFTEADALCEKGLRLASGLNHLPSMGLLEMQHGITYFAKSDGRNLIKHAETANKYCEKGGVDFFLPHSFLLLGYGYYYMRDLITARNHVQRGLQMQEDMGIQLNRSGFHVGLGMIHLDSAKFMDAQYSAEKALDFSQKYGEKWYEGISWNLLGRIFAKKRTPEMERAKECILKGIEILEEFKVKPFISRGYLHLGDLYNDIGRKNEALEYLKKAEGMFKEMDMDYYLNKTKDVLERV